MRGGDLFHHMKPQNVRGLLVLRRALQCRQNGRRVPCAVVRDGQAEAISGNIRLHLDLYGCRIMPDAVAQQVFQQSFQQGAVHAEFRLLCGSGLLQRHLAGLRLRTFAELRHQLPEQRPRRKFLLAQGLCPIFQLAGQVQILDQGAEFFALGADASGLLPGSFRQDGVPLQLLRPAQDQRQRGAHIVADPGDPLGAGIVPPGQQFVPRLQLRTGPVQLFGQFPGKALRRQLYGLPLGQRIQPGSHRFQPLGPLPAEQKTADRCQQQQQPKPQRNGFGKVQDVLRRGVNAVFPQTTSGKPDDEQAIVLCPAEHRIIVQIPAGKPRHFSGGIDMVQRVRQSVTPPDISGIVQHHGPCIAVHPFFRGVRCAKSKPRRSFHHGIRNFAGRIGSLRQTGRFLPAQKHQQPKAQKHQQQNDAHRRQNIPPDEPHKGFHRASSFASLYPIPRTVCRKRGLPGSGSSFSRRCRI